jgi:hypothetical protein
MQIISERQKGLNQLNSHCERQVTHTELLSRYSQRTDFIWSDRVSDFRQTEIRTDEPLVPDSSPLEVETAIAKLKRYKSPGSDQIPAELIQAGGEILRSENHKLITSIWNKENLPDQWNESILPVHKKSVKTEVIIVDYHCYQLHTKFYLISFSQG